MLAGEYGHGPSKRQNANDDSVTVYIVRTRTYYKSPPLLIGLLFFHIFHIISQFSSIFSISFHYSSCLSSVFPKSFHYSTWVSSIFSISFHYSTYFSSIFPILSLFSSVFSISFHYSTYFSSSQLETGARDPDMIATLSLSYFNVMTWSL
jgi:hypothetical protein